LEISRDKGFDDGGWWLGVEGCRGGQRSPELIRKLAEKQRELAGSCYHGVEKGERKWSFGLSCVLLANLTPLAEFLTSKVTF